MNASRLGRCAVWGLVMLFVLGASAPTVEAKGSKSGSAKSSRPSSGSSFKGRSAAPPAKRSPGFTGDTSRTRVGGHASYGHYRYPWGHYRPYYYDPYLYFNYGYPGYYSGFLGWPYLAWGWYPPVRAYHEVTAAGGRAPATVETAVKPRKASVYLDGDYAGQARDFNGSWDAMYVDPGVHTFEFRRDGYMSLSIGMRVGAGGYYRISERLQKGEGVDPRSVEAPPQPEPPPARTPPESFRGEAEVGTEQGAASGLRQGLLHIRAVPADAAVYLDGEFLASAQELTRLHGAIPVAVGEHTVEIVRPGYRTQTQVVRVGEGEPQWVVIELEREN